MSVGDRVRGLFGFGNGERLVEFPSRFERVQVDALHVHTVNLSPDTDEKIVVVTSTPDMIERLRGLRAPVQVFSCESERPVTFVPSKRTDAPVLDPKQGWIIPVSPATAEELSGLPSGPGEHQLSTVHLGLVLEA